MSFVAQPNLQATALKRLPQLLGYASSQMPIREQYFFFLDVGTVFPALAVLATASGMAVDQLAPLSDRYLTQDLRKFLVEPPFVGVNGPECLSSTKWQLIGGSGV